MSIKLFFLRFFTWWNGANLNTHVYTTRHGELVGHDEFGNAYYRTRGGAIDPALGFERRWVIYNGVSEASMTPPGWNGWLHHTVDIAADRGNLRGARLGVAASRQSHRHPGGDPSRRVDAAARASTGDRRRLSGLDPEPEPAPCFCRCCRGMATAALGRATKRKP